MDGAFSIDEDSLLIAQCK
uniref:Uncharacterized protein n=1 Tax=Musa acuminata subsp. malaccensis TaxID=214687 RepID=A0A804JLT7_MUSAM